MTDGELSCQEVFDFFSPSAARVQPGRQLSEGAQNAFVNLYNRLAANCPATGCEQLDSCILLVDGRPKAFDGEEGKLRFLRMKVRTEGRRLHRRDGVDVLTSGQVDLVGEDDWRLGGGPGADPLEDLRAAALRDEELERALSQLRSGLVELDLDLIPGGFQNVAVAAEVALRLIDHTAAAPVPESQEERREVVRALLDHLAPGIGEGSAAAVRQRQKRLRGIVREALAAADGAWFAELWVPLETTKQR